MAVIRQEWGAVGLPIGPAVLKPWILQNLGRRRRKGQRVDLGAVRKHAHQGRLAGARVGGAQFSPRSGGVIGRQVKGPRLGFKIHPLRIVGVKADRPDHRSGAGGRIDLHQAVARDVQAIHLAVGVDGNVNDGGRVSDLAHHGRSARRDVNGVQKRARLVVRRGVQGAAGGAGGARPHMS